MKTILKNRKGVTLLEGLIAMGLLALVAAGTFGVLLSVSHKAGKPDIREEMALAVEKANDQLHAYSQNMDSTNLSTNSIKLCDEDTQSYPLDSGEHNIVCLLPVICDRSVSSFTYNVEAPSDFNFVASTASNKDYINNANYDSSSATSKWRKITFSITCNGFTL